MKTKVKIIDFNRRDLRVEDAENQLADLLDEGYSIVGQSEFNGVLTYTLVMRQIDIKYGVDDEHIPAVALLAGMNTGSPIAPRGNTISKVAH
ncbi:hypothetical protein Hena1_01990 [Erwinia phage Hena1]|uniref:Uncharacterized protein n=1 Tax=Erwinia phage Hena1 TaxID=2678601 RepID=A0A6B9J9Z1_9CAUD|nr:DNA ligase [Erwinia phage Hena1]QGZ16349.1 hypothetical protein Hena1_01990 [Erwinia phage Hena1]